MLNNKFKLLTITTISVFSIFFANISTANAEENFKTHIDDIEIGISNLNNTSSNSAKFGDILLHPEKGWKRFDNTNSNISGIFEYESTEPFKFNYKQTSTNLFHDNKKNTQDKLEFTFKGSKLRLIGNVYDKHFMSMSDRTHVVNFYIDGNLVGYDKAIEGNKSFEQAIQLNWQGDMGVHKLEIKSLPGNNQGISYNLDAIDVDGELTSNSDYIVHDKKPKLNLESIPNNSTKFNDCLKVSGWALNDSGVKYINIYLNNALIGNTKANINRPDVDSTFPNYTNGINSGFDFSYNVSNYKSGTYTVKIEVIGNNDTKQSFERKINIERKQPKMWIDTPNNKIIENNLDFYGWSLNDSGVKKIDIYVDNNYLTSTNTGGKRPDVNNVFPGYKNGSISGFSKNLDLSKFSNGKHTVKAISIGEDGTTSSKSIDINIKRKEPKLWIETPSPSNDENTARFLTIGGWALNDSGIKDVKVFIDGKAINPKNILSLSWNGIRNDVDKAFPGYKDGVHSGINAKIDMNDYMINSYVLKVTVIGNDGSSISCERRFLKQ